MSIIKKIYNIVSIYAKLLTEGRFGFMSSSVQMKFLIKAVCMYLFYFLYSNIASSIVAALQITNTSYVSFIADILFMVLIIFVYRKELKEDFQELKEKFPAKRILKNVLIGVGIIFLLKIVMGMVTEVLSPNVTVDSNTSAILDLLKTSPVYAVFKTMIFAVISEEILFRKAVSTCIKNDWTFVIVGAVIYTFMNFVFNTGSIVIADLLMYFMTALALNYIYIKNDRNIYMVMIIKFIMQFLPFIVLFML